MPRTPKSLVASLLAPPPENLARGVFWLGVIWLLLGMLVTFAPGAEAVWYSVSAVFLAGGLYIPHGFYRRAVSLLIIWCAVLAVAGCVRAIEYRAAFPEHSISVPAPKLHRPNNALQRTEAGGGVLP